ncbi:hypothetical protein GCM10010219_46960 [Streptomyces netropsis]|nr:hypothetical protein GCM10010219_46960 [Streptomyces netropsis]
MRYELPPGGRTDMDLRSGPELRVSDVDGVGVLGGHFHARASAGVAVTGLASGESDEFRRFLMAERLHADQVMALCKETEPLGVRV